MNQGTVTGVDAVSSDRASCTRQCNDECDRDDPKSASQLRCGRDLKRSLAVLRRGSDHRTSVVNGQRAPKAERVLSKMEVPFVMLFTIPFPRRDRAGSALCRSGVFHYGAHGDLMVSYCGLQRHFARGRCASALQRRGS